jgi:ribosomal protein S21
MIQVTKKDKAESTESLIRRFTRKVQQSGMLITAKENQYFEKPISKRERRIKAISRRARRAEKVKRLKLGLK